MSFKHFLQLNEWIHNDTSLRSKLKYDLSELSNLINRQQFIKAEYLLEMLWTKLTAQLKFAEQENETTEITFVTNILNKLHNVNINTKEIRNIKTQSF